MDIVEDWQVALSSTRHYAMFTHITFPDLHVQAILSNNIEKLNDTIEKVEQSIA